MVLKILVLIMAKQIEFPVTVDCCDLWILDFAELAKPLYEATKEGQDFLWTEHHKQTFDKLKQSLLSSPALDLLDVTKPFHVFVNEHRRIAKGVLT